MPGPREELPGPREAMERPRPSRPPPHTAGNGKTAKVLEGNPKMEEAKDLAAIFREETPRQEEAKELAAIFREFLDKMEGQKKAMDMAIILNAKNPRAGIQVVEEQRKDVDLIAHDNKGDKTGMTKELLKAAEMSKELPTKEFPKTAEPPQELPKATELP